SNALSSGLGFANKTIAALRARHGAAHEQQVLVYIDPYDSQILRRFSLIPHVPRKMLPLPHARRKRTSADSTRCAMEHRAVGRVASSIVPALHAALESLAFAHAGYVDELADLEAVDQHAITCLRFIFGVADPYFANVAHRRHAGFFEVTGQGFSHALWLDELDKAKLHRVIAVLVLRSSL